MVDRVKSRSSGQGTDSNLREDLRRMTALQAVALDHSATCPQLPTLIQPSLEPT